MNPKNFSTRDETGNAALDSILTTLVVLIACLLVITLTASTFLRDSQNSHYPILDASPLNILVTILLATVPVVMVLRTISRTAVYHQTERE
jgi:TRAP-type C4-dicarboxylate transport system permease small subunit